MSEIVYLLGAGASFGERGDGKKSYIFTKRIEDKEISKPGSCININEGFWNEVQNKVVRSLPSDFRINFPCNNFDALNSFIH